MFLALGSVLLRPRDDDQTIRATDDSTTTTEDQETTTTELETTTTTATATTTTTTAAPVTAVPPSTAPPATAPPTTSPPPTTPPNDPGPLDMNAVLAFAKAGSGGQAPVTYTGAKTCPASVNRPSDAGDDSARDISDWYLARYCDGVYRAVLATTTDTPTLHPAWLQANTKPGGCSGIDFVVIGWHTTTANGGTGGRGAVVATPRCGTSSWRWVEPAGFPVFNGAWLQLDFRGSALGSPSAFDWRGAVRAAGESGSAIDMVPNGGPEHFTV